MKKAITAFFALVLSLSLAACGTTQVPTAETAAAPTTIPTTVPETTETPKELVFYDSYYAQLPHMPIPESFVDVAENEDLYKSTIACSTFCYDSTELGADYIALVDTYCAHLSEYGFTVSQYSEDMRFIYEADTLVGVVEYSNWYLYVHLFDEGHRAINSTAQVISLKDTATSGSAELTPNAIGSGTQVKASDELFETTITCRNDSNCLLWIEADLRNLTDSSVEFQYNYSVTFIFDKVNTHNAKLVATPRLPSGSEKAFVWYVEIPKYDLENCQSVTARIAFLDQFQEQGSLLDESTLLCDIELTAEEINTLKSFAG